MSSFKKQICFSCSKPITPYENAVKFPCPQCGDVTIWRCERCRIMGNTYKCLKCEFEGP